MSDTAIGTEGAGPESAAPAPFIYEDDPDLPGWKRWHFRDPTRFNALLEPVHVRREGDIAIVRMTPQRHHSNLRDNMHGGALLAFIDIAMFAGARAMGVLQAGGAVTLDLSCQFIGGAELDRPVEAHVELLRRTTRLMFMRGLVQQEGAPTIASFTGTLRLSSPPTSLAKGLPEHP